MNSTKLYYETNYKGLFIKFSYLLIEYVAESKQIRPTFDITFIYQYLLSV